MIDIESELSHYKDQFEGKTVYCNCDHPHKSNFVKYFLSNFKSLGLKRLISSCYISQQRSLFDQSQPIKSMYLMADSEETVRFFDLKGDGDFRSGECVELLKQSDIIITNPPFSLFVDFTKMLFIHKKKFLFISPTFSISYVNIFNELQMNKAWLGYSNVFEFEVPRSKKKKNSHCVWLTNLEVDRSKRSLVMTKKYSSAEYPKLDNFDAINVNRTCDIPMDYSGVMAVPISFIEKYNPNQFELIRFLRDPFLKNKLIFRRLIIRSK